MSLTNQEVQEKLYSIHPMFHCMLTFCYLQRKYLHTDQIIILKGAFKGSNSTIGFQNSAENLEQVSPEVNANFRLSLQRFKVKPSPLDKSLLLIDYQLQPFAILVSDKDLSSDKSHGTQNEQQLVLRPCSPPLYQSPNRWVPATPTTEEEDRRDDLKPIQKDVSTEVSTELPTSFIDRCIGNFRSLSKLDFLEDLSLTLKLC